jgi:putative Ca2+/H+ antiporter (TMEM165/GDT1 family)
MLAAVVRPVPGPEIEGLMRSLLAAMGLVFVAELGDKTQLVALGFGARHRLAPTLIGVAAGYAVCNLLSVVVGGVIGAALPTRAIGLAGGVLFLGFALWTLRPGGDQGAAGEAGDGGGAGGGAETSPVAPLRAGSVSLTVALAIIVAEMGDKTMIATATLAAQGDPVLVWIGATIGITCAGALGVLAGRLLGARIPDDAVRIGSAALFAVFGTVLIVTNV